GLASAAAPHELAIRKAEARDRAAETLVAGFGQLEARIEERPSDVRADPAVFREKRAGRQVHEARIAVAAHTHDARDRAIVEDAPGAARALETVEREQLAGNEAARGIGVHLFCEDGRRSQQAPEHDSSTQGHEVTPR